MYSLLFNTSNERKALEKSELIKFLSMLSIQFYIYIYIFSIARIIFIG